LLWGYFYFPWEAIALELLRLIGLLFLAQRSFSEQLVEILFVEAAWLID
jgi:hypothetical protein